MPADSDAMILAVAIAGGLVVLACSHSLASGARARTGKIALLGMLLYLLVLLLRPTSLILTNGALLLVAGSVGAMIGYALGSRVAILVFCILMTVVDAFSFNEGLTRRILEAYAVGDAEMLPFVALTIPVEDRLLSMVGLGDLLVMSALHSGFQLLGTPAILSVTVLLLALAFAVLIGLGTGGVPALPVIAAGAAALLLTRRGKAR